MIAWHYDHSKGKNVKGVNVLTVLLRYKDINIPIAYEIVKKNIEYCDVETRTHKRKSSTIKNEQICGMIDTAIKNDVKFKYILADNCFSSKENMQFIHDKEKEFIIGLKSNRLVALSGNDKKKVTIKTLNLLT